MAQEDNLHKLYINLTDDGYNLGTEDEFRKQLQNNATAEKFHQNMVDDGYQLGSFDEFVSMNGLSYQMPQSQLPADQVERRVQTARVPQPGERIEATHVDKDGNVLQTDTTQLVRGKVATVEIGTPQFTPPSSDEGEELARRYGVYNTKESLTTDFSYRPNEYGEMPFGWGNGQRIKQLNRKGLEFMNRTGGYDESYDQAAAHAEQLSDTQLVAEFNKLSGQIGDAGALANTPDGYAMATALRAYSHELRARDIGFAHGSENKKGIGHYRAAMQDPEVRAEILKQENMSPEQRKAYLANAYKHIMAGESGQPDVVMLAGTMIHAKDRGMFPEEAYNQVVGIINNEHAEDVLAGAMQSADAEIARLEGLIEQRTQQLFAQDEAEGMSFAKVMQHAESGSGAPIFNQRLLNDPELSMLWTAKRAAERRKKVIERKQDNHGFMRQFIGTFWDTATDINTWDFGIQDMRDAVNLASFSGNESLSVPMERARQAMLQNTVDAQEAEQRWKLSAAQRWGVIGGQALPFVAEFIGTGGGFSGARQAVTKGVTSFLEKSLGKAASSKAAQWLVRSTGMLTGDIASALLMANTTGSLKTYSDILDRKTGDLMQLYDGTFVYRNSTTMGDAILKGEVANTLEYYTEMLGNHLDGLISGVGKRLGLSRLSEGMKWLTGRQIQQLTTNVLRQGGINELPSEILEEEANLILNAMLVGDNNFDTGPLKELANKFGCNFEVDPNSEDYQRSIFNPETQADIWGGMLFSIGAMRAPSVAIGTVGQGWNAAKQGWNTANYYYYKHKTDLAGAKLNGLVGGDELLDRINNTTNEQIPSLVAGILADDDFTPDMKSLAMDYIGNLVKERGYNVRMFDNAKDLDPEQDQEEGETVDLSYQEGYNAADEEQAGVKERLDVARQRLRDLGYNDHQMSYLEGLDEQGMLDEFSEMEGWEGEGADAVREFLNARAAYEGMVQHVQDDMEGAIAESEAAVDQQTHIETGAVHHAVLKTGGEVWVVGGNVALTPEGNIDIENSDGDLIVLDPATGGKRMIHISDLASADEPVMADQLKEEAATTIQETMATDASNRIDGVLSFQPGDEYTLPFGEEQHTITIIGDAGDGVNTVVSVDGGEQQLMPMQMIQEAADAQREARIAEQAAMEAAASQQQPVEQEPEATEEVTEEPVEEEQPDEDAMPMNGDEVDWFATSPERGHRFLYDEAGLSPEEADAVVANSVKDAEKELEKVSKKAPKPGNAAQLNKYRAEKAAHEQQVAAAQAAVDYWKGVQATQEAIRQQAEAELLAQRAEEGKQRSEAAAQTEAEKEAQRLADREAARQEREALNGVPDVVNDKPEDARARGFRNVNGERVDRQLLTNSVGGRTGSVKFSTDVTVPSRIAVIEADELQPSHIEGQRNPLFFLDEAQPKNRTDQASDVAAEKIAKNINPEEITGDGGAYQFSAPTVNERGEVVQGNNRSSALKRMWSSGAYADSQQRYKQYLIDHAEEFSLDPKLVASMNRPVMVNEISVDDAEAIRLGQMSAKDLESGGIERIDPVTTARKLGPKMRNFASVLLSGEDENMSLAELIAANGEAAVKWLADRGVISPTQVQSAWNPAKTGLTAEAKLDLQNILRQQLFQGGVSDLPHMFEAMPAKAQKAILSTFMRDMDSADADRILPELQHAIEAWYGAASGTSDFSKATNYEAASRAMLGWTNVRNAFSGVLPSEKFSKFAIELANRLQGSSMRNMVTYFNEFYDLVQGTGVGDLFGSGVSGEKLTLAEAIAKIFNVDINETNNGQERSEDVGSDRGDGQEGRQGEPGDAAGPEPATPGAGTPERGGRAESNDQSVAQAEAEVDTEPTDGQKEAGNYKKGHVKIDGFDVTIEQPKGSVRSGVDASGKPWSQEMHNTYGYIRGTEGVDGDHIDVFLSDHLDNWNGMVYVVDQVNKDGSFDEHKVMYGFDSEQEARDAYLSNYEDGWTGLGNITGVTRDEFKKWVDSSHRKTKPFAEYKSVKVSRPIQGLEGYTEDEILADVRAFIEEQLEDAGIEGVTIKGMALHGSRMRGDARPDSDLDVVVEYEGDISEDAFFNLVNYDLNFRGPNGVIIDINPITEGKSGTLEQYMERSRRYDEEKRVRADSPHYTDQADVAGMLAEEFKDEIEQAKARVEIVAESASDGEVEAVANVTVDGEPSDIWLASGEGRMMDEHWKLVYIPFTESEWQEIADLAEAFNKAQGKEVCRDDADAKRINFDTIDEAVAFERWREGRGAQESRADGGAEAVSDREAALRDGLVEVLRGAGIEVVTDAEEGQRVLDAVNGRMQAMGFANSREEFDNTRDRAVAETGIVMTGLAEEEVTVVDVPRHDFTGVAPIKQAEAWGKKNLVTPKDKKGNYIDKPKLKDGTEYSISSNAVGKFLSKSATKNSDNLGVHLSVLKKLKDVIHESMEAEVHPDYKKDETGKRDPKNGYNPDYLVHRLYGAVDIDGKTYRVKTTIIENGNESRNYPHSYEVTEIELLDDSMAGSESRSVNIGREGHDTKNRLSNNSIVGAKLLQGVEKSYDPGKKLLDESRKSTESGVKEQRVENNAALSESLFDGAKKKFGVTRDIREAGYVLPDGSMLDFSGRHELDPGTDSSFLRGQRATDHRDISKIAYGLDENGDEVETGLETTMPDFIERGAIRIDYNAGNINLAVAPTAAQRRVLRTLIAGNGGEVQVDFGNGWDSNHYAEYSEAKAARVLADIDRYFAEGIKPQGDYQFFRTADGTAYGFVKDGRIYIDPRIATSETPVHEYTHLWCAALRRVNPEAWARLKEALLGHQDVVDHVKRLYPELEGDELMDEVFAHYSGRRGRERLQREQEREEAKAKGIFDKARVIVVFDRIRRALDNFWLEARHLFAGKTEGLEKLSAEDFADMALADLLGGFNPNGGRAAAHGTRAQRTAPTFYSNAERAVEGVKQNKATAEQWKAMLTKAGGIKAGEDKWMGLTEWLDEHKGETLTKEQVLEFVRQNGVQMEEVDYSEAPDTFESLKQEYDQWLHDEGFDYAQEQLRERFGDDADIAFDDLGGELVVANEEAAAAVLGSENIINSTRLDLTTEGLENKREIAFVVPDVEPYQENDEIHFGPENQGRAVMWVRFGEARDADGKRVLVIDEIQSNRHQDARENGYDLMPKDRARYESLAAQRKQAMEAYYARAREVALNGGNFETAWAEDNRAGELFDAWGKIDKEIKQFTSGDIPAAPFEKNWHEVAMKRMLRLAAEEGFDKVAWTTGGQQAERYDIGNAIERIEKLDDRAFLVYPKDGSAYQELEFDEDGVYRDDDDALLNNKTMADIFGKETAEKLKNLSDGDQLTGEGLRIGGEGMKGFYDQMLPRFMDKYGKRWGVKTGEVTLATPGGETMHSVDVTPEMRRSVLEQGQPLFQKAGEGDIEAINERFNEQLQRQIDGTLPKGHVYELGKPSDVLLSTGIDNLPIELVASRLVDKSMQDNHPFDLEEVRDLPKSIHTPLAVFRSATHVGRYVILTVLKHGNRNFVVAIETNRQVGKLFVNSVRSVHPRNGMNIVNWINEGLAEYIRPDFEAQWLTPFKNELRSKPQYNSADVRAQLKSAAKVVKEFVNPALPDEKNIDAGDEVLFRELDDEEDAELIAELESGPTVTTYSTKVKVDGGYIPPMSSKDNETGKMRKPEREGKWNQAEERPDMAYFDKKSGKWKFDLKKSNNKTTGHVDYNPYGHSGSGMLNDQFSEAQSRPDLVVVEMAVPESEVTSGYKAEKANDPVGWKPWKAGPITAKMTGTRQVMLSRWHKITREVPWPEVAQSVARDLGNQFDVLPTNTFPVQLRAELEKLGYQFIETNNKGVIQEGPYKGLTWTDRYYDINPELDKRKDRKKRAAHTAAVVRANSAQYTDNAEARLRDALVEGGRLAIINQGGKWRIEGMPGEFGSRYAAIDEWRERAAGNVVWYLSEDGDYIEVEGNGDMYEMISGGRGGSRGTGDTAAGRKRRERLARQQEARSRSGRRMVDELAEKLGIKVRYVEDMSEQERAQFSERQLRSKGWYNPRTGEVFINLGRHTRLYDILSTFLHETVAHKGLRRLFGKDFDTFLDNVYNNVNKGIRAEIDRMAEQQKSRATEAQRARHDDEHWRRVATEEYMAKLAERLDLNHPEQRTLWEKIKGFLLDKLRKIGVTVADSLSDNDLRGILWESYHSMESEGVMGYAKGVAFRDQMEREANGRGGSRGTGDTVIAAEPQAQYTGSLFDVLPQAGAWARMMSNMSERELRNEIAKDGPNVTSSYSEEYDRRHIREYNQACDEIQAQLERELPGEERLLELLQDAEAQWADGAYKDSRRTGVLAAIDTISRALDEERGELPRVEEDVQAEGSQYGDNGDSVEMLGENNEPYNQQRANDIVRDFPNSHAVKEGFAAFCAVDSEDALEQAIADNHLTDEEAEDLREKYNDPGTLGCALREGKDLIAIFTHKLKSLKDLEEVNSHETMHIAYGQLGREEHNRFNNAILNWFRSKSWGNKFIDALQAEHDPKDWADETMAYFVGHAVKKHGWKKFFSGKVNYGNEEINNFVSRIKEIIINEEEFERLQDQSNADAGRNGSRGRAQRPTEDNNRLRQPASVREAGEVSLTPAPNKAQEQQGGQANGEVAPSDEDLLFNDSDGTIDEYNRAVNTMGKTMRVAGRDFKPRMTRYNFQEAFQDAILSVKKLQQVVCKAHGLDKLPSKEDAWTYENRLSSINMHTRKHFIEKLYEPMMKVHDKLIKHGATVDGITEYVICKHGLERNQVFAERDAQREAEEITRNGGTPDMDALRDKYRSRDYSGLTAITGLDDIADIEADAQRRVDKFEREHGALCGQLWDAVNKATKWTLRVSYDRGMMSTETYIKVRDMFQHYVPLRGWDETTAEDVYDYMMGERGAFNGTLKAAMGRTSLADDPFATIGNMGESAIVQGNRNRLKQRLWNMATQHPTDVCQVRDMWVVQDAQGEWVPDFPDIPEDADGDTVSQLLEIHDTAMTNLEQQGKAKRVTNRLDVGYHIDPKHVPEHAVVVMMNGNRHVVYINGNPRAAQAINGNLSSDKGSKNAIRRLVDFIFKDTRRYYSSVVTSYNINFSGANFVRDLPHAYAMTFTKYGWRKAAKYIVKSFQCIPWVIKNQAGYSGNSNMDQLFREFVAYGGVTGYAHINDIDSWKADNRRRMARLNALGKGTVGTLKGIKAVIHAVGWFSETLELIPRFTTYCASRDMGMDIQSSIKEAKDITTNFNKKGTEMTPGVWGAVANTLRYTKMFFNPIVQGMYQWFDVAKDSKAAKARLTGIMLWMPAMGALIPYLNQFLLAAIGGDDDDDYFLQNEFTRRQNMLIWTGNGYAKIPIAPVFRELYGMGETIATRMCGRIDDMKMAADFVDQLRAAFSLEGQTNYREWSIARAISPEQYAPIVDIMNNENFTGKSLWYESEWNKTKPEYTKAKESTWSPLVNISRTINGWLGGDEDIAADKSGKWLNPVVWQHLLTNYGGGFAQVIGDASSTINNLAHGEATDVSQWPIAKRFYTQPTEKRANWARYGIYKQYEIEFNKAKDKFAALKKRGLSPLDMAKEISEFAQRHPKAVGVYASWNGGINGADYVQKLKDLREKGDDAAYWATLKEAVEKADYAMRTGYAKAWEQKRPSRPEFLDDDELHSTFDNSENDSVRAVMAKEIATRGGVQDYFSHDPYENYGDEATAYWNTYRRLRISEDVVEDGKASQLLDDNEKETLKKIKKQLGQGGDDEQIMDEYRRERRRLIEEHDNE